MKFLALAVSGLLLATGASYAQHGTGASEQGREGMSAVLKVLKPEQRAAVKQYAKKNETQRKAIKEALKKDRDVLFHVIISQEIDQNAMHQAIKNLLADEDKSMVMHVILLNYIYNNVATPEQKPVIAKQIQSLLQRDHHARDKGLSQ